MLKAGEYSPNNPLVRAERNTGDVLLALGEYERRRNTLRKLRQQQYKDYLDEQAKKKQEAKEQAQRERREREEKERLREERDRERLLLEQERRSPVRRPSLNYNISTKVDTGVQVTGLNRPLSVAVQTDDAELYRVSWPAPCCMTQAERELSPRMAAEHMHYELHKPHHEPNSEQNREQNSEPSHELYHKPNRERRNTTSELPLTANLIKRSNQDKLLSDLRHSYMPSIFDADAIELRNLQAEKEAAERRQFYQQELKNQIMEQQRIKEERKSREKLLEQAELRRLEEQLKMLRMAQDSEIGKQTRLDNKMIQSTIEYNKQRTELQKDIDFEQKCLKQPTRKKVTVTDRPTKLPPQYPRTDKNKKPFSINISDNSLFSPNYDVDSYLRRNLNYNVKEDKNKNYLKNDDLSSAMNRENKNYSQNEDFSSARNRENENYSQNEDFSSARNKENKNYSKNDYSPAIDDSIPILKHSPINRETNNNNLKNKYSPVISSTGLKKSPIKNTQSLSDAMKKVDDKWKVPAVQKNILKSLPNDEGKNMSILTQLGSIRRQLQLEQLKLDQMLPKEDA